ncbi:hypothetical protein G9A89_016142 [Geosiphon pyriformis]|nr:hypothetical protein G9A89_016142 [Geosiphon pyriformis]
MKQCFLTSNLKVIEVYMDRSLKNFGTWEIECGAAAYFLDMDLGIGVRVDRLVFSTLAELQAALDACTAELVLASPDFHNCCWMEDKRLSVVWHKVKRHLGVVSNEHADKLVNSAASLNLVLFVLIKKMFIKTDGMVVSGNIRHFVQDIFRTVNCAGWEVKPSSTVIASNIIGDVNWVHTALVWHLDLHMTAGFTSKSTANLHLYFLKALHYCLPVTVQKHYYK